MAFTHIYNGVVLYHLITAQQENLFTAFQIQITPFEAMEIIEHWLDEAKSLSEAVKRNDKTLARHIANDPSKTWLCNGYCDYLGYCDEGKKAVDELIKRRTEAKALRIASKKKVL